MYNKLQQLLQDLDAMNIHPFVGYGNPDAEILIIGKECTSPNDSVDGKKFFTSNYDQWKKSFEGHGFCYRHGVEPYDFEHGNFHPVNPYFRLENKMQSRKKEIGRPSPTYYYYQRLVDKIRTSDGCEYKKSEFIDFFQDCFITELNDICRLNDKNLKKSDHEDTENHIRERFDWMRRTNFFNQFKVVVLACGHYADAIKKDDALRKELFGEAYVVYSHQLSYWDKTLDEKITDIQKQLLTPH